MKRAFAYRLCAVIVISMLVIIFLSYYIQITSAKSAIYDNSLIRINQISQILEKNNFDVEQMKESLKEDYLIRAKAAAYIVQNNEKLEEDLAEIKKVASLLQVDELHLFDKQGRLYFGTQPQYYDYTFNSGEQMQFFLPMLDDYSLQLCQDVLPNTAENKLIQYIAVWREDHKGIIQIGMEPFRLIDAMAKNELSYIFTLVTSGQGTDSFVADPKTGAILGGTDAQLDGKTLQEIGVSLKNGTVEKGDRVDVVYNGKKSYCVILPSNNVLIGVTTTYENLYDGITSSMVLIVISLCILSFIIIIVILKMLDKFIIHDIHNMISGMNQIASGDLDYRVEVNTSPEFVELSNNINDMVMSLLETTGKLSLVFENVNIPIAAYEYSSDMKRVLATSKIGEILMLTEENLHFMLQDHEVFHQKIIEICARPFTGEEDTFIIEGNETRYVKIKSYQEDSKTLGIIVDVTNEVLEKKKIEFERDIDLLTGLLTRRAFYAESNKLFSQPDRLRVACLLMLDMDNLKYTNDNWGHEYGDKLLKAAADILNHCAAVDKLAARLGGDEFALLIYNVDSENKIQEYIDDLYCQVKKSNLNLPKNQTISVCFSGGYIFYPVDSVNFNDMIELADQTMYKIKKGPKGCFAKYEKD